jgi:hypothetical protein
VPPTSTWTREPAPAVFGVKPPVIVVSCARAEAPRTSTSAAVVAAIVKLRIDPPVVG